MAGMVRARLPASPLFLVSGREPRAGFFEISGPTAGMVRAHLSASPLFSVSGREPRAGNFGIRGPTAGMVRARLPANPLFSVSGREPRAGSFEVWRPGGRLGSRSTPRKPFIFGFRARTAGREFRDSRPAGRVFQGAVCSLLPANPCGSVPGSKFFTQIPRRRPSPAGFSKARFAPRSPLTLAAPFRGANSSHKFRASVQKAPCRFIGKVLPSPQQSPAGPSPAGHF